MPKTTGKNPPIQPQEALKAAKNAEKGSVPKELQAIRAVVRAGLAVPDEFEKLAEIANVCRMCDLCENREHHAVFGSGNINARILLIGEGPGKNEDKAGLPYVGAAGKHLDRVLESVGFDRQRDFYISNMVKCHHRGQRPTMKQMDACAPYLGEQIQKIKPKIIILTGTSAMKGLLGVNTPITQIHGEWLEMEEGMKAMAVFHPSYLIYTEQFHDDSPLWLEWKADWAKAKRELDKIRKADGEERPVLSVPHVPEAPEIAGKAKKH